MPFKQRAAPFDSLATPWDGVPNSVEGGDSLLLRKRDTIFDCVARKYNKCRAAVQKREALIEKAGELRYFCEFGRA